MGLSVRNRDSLEKELGQSQSNREQRLQKEVRYVAEEPHSCENQGSKRSQQPEHRTATAEMRAICSQEHRAAAEIGVYVG